MISQSTHLLAILLASDLNDYLAQENEIKPKFVPCTIVQMTREGQMLFHSDFERKNLRLRLDFGDNCKKELLADKMRYMQVLLNLLSNAAKFSQAKSTVSVSSHFE